jgi:hypothetical protein
VFRYPFAVIGLVLIALTSWAVERLAADRGIERLASRSVLFAVAAIGWTIDHLTGRRPASSGEEERVRLGAPVATCDTRR